mmetsp:Transcript_5714/g.13874  ORF Transcript_5714/g.13874 Transcript_5714/m.13874 type:complete len:319 (-) Transcript_5714:400-1356(-)
MDGVERLKGPRDPGRRVGRASSAPVNEPSVYVLRVLVKVSRVFHLRVVHQVEVEVIVMEELRQERHVQQRWVEALVHIARDAVDAVTVDDAAREEQRAKARDEVEHREHGHVAVEGELGGEAVAPLGVRQDEDAAVDDQEAEAVQEPEAPFAPTHVDLDAPFALSVGPKQEEGDVGAKDEDRLDEQIHGSYRRGDDEGPEESLPPASQVSLEQEHDDRDLQEHQPAARQEPEEVPDRRVLLDGEHDLAEAPHHAQDAHSPQERVVGRHYLRLGALQLAQGPAQLESQVNHEEHHGDAIGDVMNYRPHSVVRTIEVYTD